MFDVIEGCYWKIYVGEKPVCNIQYVGEIVCCGIFMKLYVGISANKQKSFHQHTECHIQYMIYLFAVEYAS